MKQVARKSTTSVPQKLSPGSHQLNGLFPVQESSARQIASNVTPSTSVASSNVVSVETGVRKVPNTDSNDQCKDVHLTNGIHDSCERVLGNGAGCSGVMPNTHNRTSATLDTSQQQTVKRSACVVTSASDLPVSAANVQLSITLSRSSSHTDNLKGATAKHVSAGSARTSSRVASAAASSSSSSLNDVIIDVDSKPDSHPKKRSLSPADEKKCDVKKCHFDAAVGQSVKADGSHLLQSKGIDRRLRDFSNQYLTSMPNSEFVRMSKDIKEMQENQKKLQESQKKLQKSVEDAVRKFSELSRPMSQKRTVRPTAATSSAPQATVQWMCSTNSVPVPRPHSALPAHTATLPASVRMTQTTLAPCRLPTASANLAAVQRLVTVTAPDLNAVAGSSTSTSAVADSGKSVIDLTDDDDTNVPATKPPMQTPRLFLMAPQQTATIPALTVTSPATVVRSIRPLPPLHVAPNQLPRLQSCLALRHPAPLPPTPPVSTVSSTAKLVPPKPTLKLSRVANGIVLSWNMAVTNKHESAVSYHLFAYQEGSEPPSTSLWKKIGSVSALPLPMACTLTQFQLGNVYHFAVRAVDGHGRFSAFSEPGTIHLDPCG